MDQKALLPDLPAMTSIAAAYSIRLRPLIEHLRKLGHPVEPELRRVGLPEAVLESDYLPISSYRLWEFKRSLSLRTGNFALVAQAEEETSLDNLLIASELLQSPNLGALLENLRRLLAYDAPNGEFWIEPLGDELQLRTRFKPHLLPHANVFCDLTKLVWLRRIVRLADPAFTPREVLVCGPSIGPLPQQLEPLGWHDLRFNQGVNGFSIPRSMLSLPILAADGGNRAPGPTRVHDLIALQRPESFSGVVRWVIDAYQPKQWLTCAQAAAAISVSPRTLQLRLEEERLSYRQIIDDCRIRQAKTRLLSTSMTMDEISDELGYSCKSAFLRAFRRWTGVNPTEYRREQLHRTTAARSSGLRLN